MNWYIILLLSGARALNLDYLDPVKLQTKTAPSVQQSAALAIIQRYSNKVVVEVNPIFSDHKDVFSLRTSEGKLHIRASSGVAAVWGFNYYLKKYCKSQIAWQVKWVSIPDPLPEVDETVVANDRFRYYQNVCTVSYSFVWWNVVQWQEHVDWMALNGINLSLAPIAQESTWVKVYRKLGMTEDEIDQHFTGPAFLSWLRMGNVHGWGGPLLRSWHDYQKLIQIRVMDYIINLGIVPVLPAFNGHVPRAFKRIFPNTTFHSVQRWNNFRDEHCCGLFLDPADPLFKRIGKMFLNEMKVEKNTSHIYTSDPFNEVNILPWSTSLVQNTAKAIHDTLSEFDDKSVWLLQSWMFVSDPVMWPMARVQTFLTSIPNGRMLVLDLQAEQWPQYNLYEMYYGQPFIWCMLHNFGGTLGMFGNMITINKDVYETRSRVNSTMIGIGLTPEGINQNYVVYDLMLESAWRTHPVEDLEAWVGDYAERRYGCNTTTNAWKYLLKSVYSFNGLNMMRGKYVTTRQPSFKIRPWAWYRSHDLFEALRNFVFNIDMNYKSEGFTYDLIDVTRQALQYRAEQLYRNILREKSSTSSWVFNATITQFLDIMNDTSLILAHSDHFSAITWFENARSFARVMEEDYVYSLNARNQITLWGPNGEISDYACKQWAEMFVYYYIPRWSTFLSAALDAKLKHEIFDEEGAQRIVRSTVEAKFPSVTINPLRPFGNAKDLALELYEKWAYVPNLVDLPMDVIKPDPLRRITLADVEENGLKLVEKPSVVMVRRHHFPR